MRSFVKMAPAVAAVLCASITAADAVTEIWRFDFTSPSGGGYFEVNADSFVIPVSAGSPTSFTILAADLAINAGGLLGSIHYAQGDVFQTSCAPGECSLTFSIPKTISGFGTYDVQLQLNSERIWVPWITSGQQAVQM
ncbi:MAG: hypothetical protein ACREEK_29675, partial [Bradyrhizobium sp.]